MISKAILFTLKMTKLYSKRISHGVNVGRLISQVVKPVMRKRGFYDIDIIAEWEFIVGPQWAKQTSPHKLSFNPHNRRAGTLEILVSPGAAVLIQHIEPMIIDRVNTYFGFEAVNRLKIIHGHIPAKVTQSQRRNLDGPLPDVEGITDPDLLKALQGLGRLLQQEEVKADENCVKIGPKGRV